MIMRGSMRNVTLALIWAAGGALMGAGAVISLNSNVMFALMFAGLAAAFFLVAASCLLREPRADADLEHDDPESTGRRRWGPS